MAAEPTDKVGAPSAEDQLQSLVDSADLVLWAVDASGRFTVSEGRGLRALGLTPGQVVGLSLWDLYRDSPTVLDAVRSVLTAGTDSRWSVELYGRVFETRSLPLRSPDGEITGALGISFDVTDRQRAQRENERLQAQLLQVQKLESLGVLAGGIAHDFNNWLAAILASSSAVKLQLPDDSSFHAHLDNVIAATTHAAALTRQLLAYAGQGPFERKAIDLSRHVRDLLSVLETAVSRKVPIRFELDENLPAVDVDVGQLQQVIMNLVINGSEAIGDGSGTVTVRTGTRDVGPSDAADLIAGRPPRAGRYVFLEVRDDGCGMDEATRGRIFDPFFTTKFHGRGLGLAAVLGIVRAHAGAVGVSSAPGQGTTFTVLLPAGTGRAPPQAPPRDEIILEGRVLIIDDDTFVRRALRHLLELHGMSVLEAGSGPEGVRALAGAEGHCDLVLLDMTMPVMGGEETFRELRRVDPTTPIILMSGYSERETASRFGALSLAGFLQKPFTPEELTERVHAALRSRR